MLKYPLLIIVGFLAGFINVLAGGGSFLTVSAMILLGLPSTTANGTNRIAILFQNIMAAKRFRDFDVLPLRFAMLLTAPAALGALAGAYLGATMPDVLFRKVFALLMVVVSFLSLANPGRRELLKEGPFRWLTLTVGFFLVGVYGGFVQAGVGFFILAVLSLCGFDLVVSNAIKVMIILVFTVFALFVFAAKGKVDIAWGLPLAVGNVLGAYVGTSIAVKRGHTFIKRVVLACLVLVALKLLFT